MTTMRKKGHVYVYEYCWKLKIPYLVVLQPKSSTLMSDLVFKILHHCPFLTPFFSIH